ncbi:MAG: hypothetical protein Q9169_002874 [Polycauliona sp. 2 TL-2023]
MSSDAQSGGASWQPEDADMANAIKASLEIRRSDLPQAQDRWIPQSEDDWKTYRRQQQLVESSQRNAEVTRAMEAENGVNWGKVDPTRTYPSQVPHSEDDWTTYDQQQQVAPGAQSIWSLASRSLPGERSGVPESLSSDLLRGDPRALKTEDDWPLWAEGVEQQLQPNLQANQKVSDSDRDGKTARTFDFSSPAAKEALPAAAASSQGLRPITTREKVNEERTLQMQAGQRIPKSDQSGKQADSSDLQSHAPETAPETAPSESPPPGRQTIEDRIKEMQSDSIIELAWTDDRDGDTFIYIDPPTQQPEQSERMYCRYIERYQKPLVIRSAKLQALRSPFFDKLLGPTAQFRTIRRRRLNGRLPERIKYVIDLTPPSEGEDAAWLMTELCCVEGVRDWYQASIRWECAHTLVGGRDEFVQLPANLRAPEFSQIRHRSSIERVLNGIRDIDPNLDSAVKVYTTFTVARFFEITQSPLTDYIVRWLRAPPNSLFIEALPEIALKIGDGLRCHDLVRDPFAILVGEEALAILQDKSNLNHTVSGRKKNDIPEAYRTRIEYASRSFNDRVSQTFEHLVEPEMTWMETLPQFRQLSNDNNKSRELLVKETKAAMKAFVRGTVYGILWTDLVSAPKYDLGRSDWGEALTLYPWTSQTELWNSLNTGGRLMTTTFWTVLKMVFGYWKTTITTKTNISDWQDGVWETQLSTFKRDLMMQKHNIVEIRYQYAEYLVARCCWDSQWNSNGLVKSTEDQTKWLANPSAKPGEEATISRDPEDVTGKDLEVSESPKDNGKMSCYTEGIDINGYKLWREIQEYIWSICHQMLEPPDLHNRDEPMNPIMTPTLVSIGEAEWKYLPLYAGGLDDESGGVFNDDVPMAEGGFSTAGPGVHTGTGSSTASSDYDFVGGRDLESTHHTSTMTNDSFSDHLDHRKVYTDDSDLGVHIRDNKIFTGSTTASNVDTTTLAAPSTIDAESEDGFVLPLRPREPGTGNLDPVPNGHNSDIRGGVDNEVTLQEDYSDLFLDNDQDLDEDDDDDDTATEKGDNDSDTNVDEEQGCGDSEDEDMVLV